MPADQALPEPYWRAAGFHVAGNRAVRIDMLERLSDLIRARVTWRQAPEGPVPEAPAPEAPAVEAPAAEALTSEAQGAEVSTALTPEPTGEPAGAMTASADGSGAGTAASPKPPAGPSGATGDGGFRVVPELMSMVGCSGEEFASILRGLGFRLERRRIENAGAAMGGDPAKTAELDATEGADTGEISAQAGAGD